MNISAMMVRNTTLCKPYKVSKVSLRHENNYCPIKMGHPLIFSVPNILSLQTIFSSLLNYPKARISVCLFSQFFVVFIYYKYFLFFLFRTPSDCMALERTDVCFYLSKSSSLQNAKKMATLAKLH